jgi:hypothetical protein
MAERELKVYEDVSVEKCCDTLPLVSSENAETLPSAYGRHEGRIYVIRCLKCNLKAMLICDNEKDGLEGVSQIWNLRFHRNIHFVPDVIGLCARKDEGGA